MRMRSLQTLVASGPQNLCKAPREARFTNAHWTELSLIETALLINQDSEPRKLVYRQYLMSERHERP